MRRAEVFDLNNKTLFNIAGELHVRTTETGQDYKVMAIHPNRTVILTHDYNFEERTKKTNSKIELASTVWLSYHFQIENKTDVRAGAQRISL